MVAKDCAEFGIAVERDEIVRALGELIADGLAKAYLLSSREPFSTELAPWLADYVKLISLSWRIRASTLRSVHSFNTRSAALILLEPRRPLHSGIVRLFRRGKLSNRRS